MEKLKQWLLPPKDEMEVEMTANVVGELALLGGFMSAAICNLLRGKDNRQLLVIMQGFLAGKWIGRFLETRERKSLLLALLSLASGALYIVSCLLESEEIEGEQ